MRTTIQPRLKMTPVHRSGSLRRLFAAPALVAVCALVSAISLPAQAPAPQSPQLNPVPVKKTVHSRKHSAATRVETPPVTPAPVAPPPPEKPNWPAFADAAPASVVWNSHGLSISAANSSLQQILKDVATVTGIKVDGFSADQRIFGAYGPGSARDVLSQLLQGSGYNVLMIGDMAPGTPRQIVLSARQNGGAQPQPRNNQSGNQEDNEQEEQIVQEPEPPQPQQPQIQPMQPRPGFPNGPMPRTPQQIMEEMQQRQQQIQQQQQQQQPTTPQF